MRMQCRQQLRVTWAAECIHELLLYVQLEILGVAYSDQMRRLDGIWP